MADLLTTIAADIAELKAKVTSTKTFYEKHVTAIVGIGCMLLGFLVAKVL